VELCEQLFRARISTGSVEAILARAGDALTEPYEDLLERVRAAKAMNMDETGWRLQGQRRTLWGVFTERHAVLRIAADRHEDRVRELLLGSSAIVTSDRWWAYNHLPLRRRQICWAHLQRDFQAQAEGLGAEKEFGEHGLRVCDELFWAWEIYQHTGERKELKRRIRLLRRELKPILRRYAGKAPRYKRTRGLARNLLKSGPRSGPSARSTASSRPTTTPSARCAQQSSTANSPSAAKAPTARPESPTCSAPTPPAAYNAAASTSTSPTSSAPTPARKTASCVAGFSAYRCGQFASCLGFASLRLPAKFRNSSQVDAKPPRDARRFCSIGVRGWLLVS
jgi:hypothetical protein